MASPTARRSHTVSRGPGPKAYPARFDVPDEKVAWDAPFPSYEPVEFVAQSVLDNAGPDGWADGAEPPSRDELEDRGSHELTAHRQTWQFDASGRPLNPRGRTGIVNRGSLGKWGPNQAGDAIVTRMNAAGKLEFVSIKRHDADKWAIPGGMTEPNEVGRRFLSKLFAATGDEELPLRTKELLDDVFAETNEVTVYRGYVDDPRNTDHAWVETVAKWYHLEEAQAAKLPLRSGADAAVDGVRWMEISEEVEEYRDLYASHKSMVDLVLQNVAPSPSLVAAAAAATVAKRRMSLTPGSKGPLARVPTMRAPKRVDGWAPEVAEDWAARHFGMPIWYRYADGSTVQPTGSGGDLDGLYDDSVRSRDVVAARFSLNSRGGSAALAALGDTPYWREWDATGAAPPSSPVECDLTSTELLDIFDIAKPQLRLVNTVIDRLAIAERAGPRATERTISEISKLLVIDDDTFEANIDKNLRSLLPWSHTIPPIRAVIAKLNERHAGWVHDDTGSVERAPRIAAADLVSLSAKQLNDLRRIAFVLVSPEMLSARDVARHTRNLYKAAPPTVPRDPAAPIPPTAVVTVGAPGSGKSFVAHHTCLPMLAESGLGPAAESYLQIDPDYWLTSMCHNDNAMRPLVNWLNHETFLKAVRLRQHMMFDGTGKSLLNTCSRVIARLRAKGYRVHICIVLASYEQCSSNIAERFAATGRNVPAKIVKDTFDMLKHAVGVYIRQQAELCERVMIYDNEARAMELVATVCNGSGVNDALALANKYLGTELDEEPEPETTEEPPPVAAEEPPPAA